MNDINSIIITGRLTADPELKYTKTGTAVAKFSVANNKTFGADKKEVVNYFTCIAWAGFAEVVAKYYTKGQFVTIEGSMESRSWEDAEGKKRISWEIRVDNLRSGGTTKKDEPSDNVKDIFRGTVADKGVITDNPFSDDDIPL